MFLCVLIWHTCFLLHFFFFHVPAKAYFAYNFTPFIWQEEYVKAYYAALLEQQRQAEESAKQQRELSQTSMSNGLSESSSNRQVGMKSKREEGEGDDDVEWEEAPIEGKSNNWNLIALLSY